MAQPATKAKQKRKFVLPNTFVLIFGFIVLAAILTYVLPAGSYQPDPNNPDLIDPNSFTFVESSPVSLCLLYTSRAILAAVGRQQSLPRFTTKKSQVIKRSRAPRKGETALEYSAEARFSTGSPGENRSR